MLGLVNEWFDNCLIEFFFDGVEHLAYHLMQHVVFRLFKVLRLVAFSDILTYPSEFDGHLLIGEVEEIDFLLSDFEFVLGLPPWNAVFIDHIHDWVA